MSEAYIIDAVRTPRSIGKIGKGALSELHPQTLASTVLKELQKRHNLKSEEIDDVVWGVCVPKGKQDGNMGRAAALDAGFDPRVSGVQLNRACGSGITALNIAAANTKLGMEDLIIAGGCEMMSQHAVMFAEEMEKDIYQNGPWAGNQHLWDMHPHSHQGVCADAIATMEGISRQDVDDLGLESQRRADIAIKENRFSKSLVPVYDYEGNLKLDHEEFPRPSTTAEGLAALKPSFEAIADFKSPLTGFSPRDMILKKYPDLKFNGIHHAGNSSGVVDGAAAVLFASTNYVEKNGLKPRARVLSFANVGDCPTLMLNAPVPAAQKALAKAGLRVEDIDLWEINEAFAVVAEKFMRDLRLDRDKVNVNGGACALGHPIAATGAVLLGTVLDELERRDLKRGLVTMCAAGGMAPAIIIERV